jgi:hypothetical protein
MKADETVKNPVGYAMDRPMANQAACVAAYPALYADAVASATKYCAKWYKCPEGAPTYAPLKNQAQACNCHVGFQGQLTAECDLTWNGLCGCLSPDAPENPTDLNLPLTDLEISELIGFYPLASRSLTSLLKGRPLSQRQSALAILEKGFQRYHDGAAFTVKSISTGSQQGFDVFLVPALAEAARIRTAVARVRVRKDGTASIQEGSGLPGGVRRSLLTALDGALNLVGN